MTGVSGKSMLRQAVSPLLVAAALGFAGPALGRKPFNLAPGAGYGSYFPGWGGLGRRQKDIHNQHGTVDKYQGIHPRQHPHTQENARRVRQGLAGTSYQRQQHKAG